MIELFYFDVPNVFKVSIALEEMGLPNKRTPVNLLEGEQLTPEFRAISPNGKVPAIIDHDPPGGGAPVSIFESGSILIYLAEKSGKFLPKALQQRYDAIAWVMWHLSSLNPRLSLSHYFLNMANEDVPHAKAKFVKDAAQLYDVLNTRLEKNEFISGEYSIADMTCWPFALYRHLHAQRFEEFPHVMRWFKAIEQRPAVRKALDGVFIPTLEQERARNTGPSVA
jgi:GST-like protein